MPYLILALAVSFIGYRVIPRSPVRQKLVLTAAENKTNVVPKKLKTPLPLKSAPAETAQAGLVEYMEGTSSDNKFKRESVSPGKRAARIDLNRRVKKEPPENRAADWIDAEIKTLVFTGFDEPAKSITNIFKRGRYGKLEKLILKDDSMDKTYRNYVLGELEFINGKYRDAAKYYEAASSSQTGSKLPEYAAFRKAETLYNMGKYEQALELFNGIKGCNGFLIPELEFSKAQCYLKTGKTETATGIMKRLMSEYEGYHASDRANFCTGLILYYQERYGEAEDFFRRITNPDFPEHKLSEFYLAGCLEAGGKLLQAGALFKKLYEENKKSSIAGDALYERGMIFYRMKEYDSAAEIFLNVLRQYPAGSYAPYARFMTGVCRFKAGRYATALANCRHFMREYRGKEPEALIHHLSAKSYTGLGQYRAAYAGYRKVISKYPGNDISLASACRLALLYYNTGKYGDALRTCEALLKDERRHRFKIEKDILLLKAMALYRMGDRGGANAQFHGIINSVQDNDIRGKALFMLGLQYKEEGKEDMLMTGYLDLTDREGLFNDNWRAWAYYFIANAYYNTVQTEAAEKTFEYIIKNYQGTPAVKFAENANIACKVMQGEHEAAELKNREFLENFRDDESARKAALLVSGGIYFNRKNYRKAIDVYKDFVKKYPGDNDIDEALFMEGESFYKLGHFNDACKYWRKIAGRKPGSPYSLKAYNRLAYTSFGLGKYDDAVFYCRKIRKYFPGNEMSKVAQLRIAQSYYNSGLFKQAIGEYRKFIRLYPDDAKKEEVLESIRMAYYEKGLKETDSRGLAEFVKLYPGGELAGEAYWQLGIRSFEKRQYNRAAKMFRRIILEYPLIQSSKPSLYYLAESLYRSGENEEAVNAFKNFIVNFPGDTLRAAAEFHMANALFKMGKIEESREHYDEILNNMPQSGFAPDAALNKALCSKKLKKWEDAVSGYEFFIGKYPGHKKKEYAKLQVAEINRNTGNYRAAAVCYAGIRGSGEISESELLYQAAECYREAGDTAKAKQYYLLLSNLKNYKKTFYLTGLVKLAEIYMSEGLDSEAVDVYKKIMAISENEEWIAAAEAKIIELEEKGK